MVRAQAISRPLFLLYNWDRLETVRPVLGRCVFPSLSQVRQSRDGIQLSGSSRTRTLM